MFSHRTPGFLGVVIHLLLTAVAKQPILPTAVGVRFGIPSLTGKGAELLQMSASILGVLCYLCFVSSCRKAAMVAAFSGVATVTVTQSYDRGC